MFGWSTALANASPTENETGSGPFGSESTAAELATRPVEPGSPTLPVLPALPELLVLPVLARLPVLPVLPVSEGDLATAPGRVSAAAVPGQESARAPRAAAPASRE